MGERYDLYCILFVLISTAKSDIYFSTVENATVYLNCGKKTDEPVVKTKWLDPTGADATIHDCCIVASNGSLVIKNARRYDAGLYTCRRQIKTDKGLTPKSLVIYLNVKYPPTIDIIKPYIRVFQNTRVVLPCSAKGNPGVTFQWRYPNKSVIANSKKHLLFTNGSLLVRSVQTTDVFTYTCAPYNDVGEGLYGYTRLDILIPPKFREDEKKRKNKVNVLEGGSASLNCNATGIPQPNVTWTYLNGSISVDRMDVSVLGIFILKDVKGVDAGMYMCSVESIAGHLKRSFVINVIGKPIVPTKFAVMSLAKRIHVTWVPAYNGGSPQEFELWYRTSNKSDYEWLMKVDNSSDNQIVLNSDKVADPLDLYHYYSLRARNVKGYSDFTPIIKARTNMLSDDQLVGEKVTQISKNPLEPYRVVVNVSSSGYNLTWRYMITPGRPPTTSFVVEYREENSTSGWQEFRSVKRSRRSIYGDEHESVTFADTTEVEVLAEDIVDSGGPLEFQVSSVTSDNIRSAPSKPSVVFRTGMPAGSGQGKEKVTPGTVKSEADDLIPAIVLGSIFGVFVIILVVSLYCFCRRKKRCQGRKNGQNHAEKNGGSKISTYVEYTDAGKANEMKFNADSPRRFHVRTCPALQLGKSTSNNNHNDGKRQTDDDVFILMEPNTKEKLICTCNKKYFTLGHRDQPKKNPKKKLLYKSSSSPSVLLASETDDIPIDTTELLVDEEFDVSELEEDAVAELNSSRIPQLERSAFKDSYDPFCRSESIDASFNKEVASIRSAEVPLKTACKDSITSNDVSSSGTVESDRSIGTNLTKETHRDSKSSDGKSSGYGEGISSNISSNNFENFNPITRFVPLTSRSDIGYYSDASSRLSPLEFLNNKYHPAQRSKYATIGHHTQYFSEDETILNSLRRPAKPPSYTQAIVDIERVSEKSEKTDSEISFDHLLEMERQLGVRLADSDDSDLTTRSLMTSRYRHSIPRNYFSDTGYTSDVASGSWRDKYTNREKTLRCNQLLEEFKSTRKAEPTILEDPRPLSPNRPYSLVDNIIPEEEVVKRKISSSSTYNEWLV